MPRFDVVIHGNPGGHCIFINEKDNVVKNTINKSFFMSFYNHVIKKEEFHYDEIGNDKYVYTFMTPSRESGGRTGGYAGISIVLTGFRYKNSDKYDKWSEKMREYFYNIITHDKNIFKTTQPLQWQDNPKINFEKIEKELVNLTKEHFLIKTENNTHKLRAATDILEQKNSQTEQSAIYENHSIRDL